MKTVLIKCNTYYDWLEARAILGDLMVNYSICMEKDEETGKLMDERFVVFSVNHIRWIFIKRRLERDIERGARYKILETY